MSYAEPYVPFTDNVRLTAFHEFRFPLRERGKAVGLTTMSNFFFNTVVAASFSYTMDASPAGSFGFFCACIFANLTLAYFFLPETAHKTAAEMEDAFMTHEPKLCRGKKSS